MHQQRLIQAIHKQLRKDQSAIDTVAQLLDISYDAAHRRLSMKSKFSIDEAASLAQHFGISMDRTFLGSENVLVRKTKGIKSVEGLAQYLADALQALTAYAADPQTKLYYSAKDIPLFYTIEPGLLSRFKLYVWLNLLDVNHQVIPFESFQFQAPILESSQAMNRLYGAVTTHEIWNDTTINSTLQQIMYFYQAGLLSAEHGEALYDSVKELMAAVEERCTPSNEQYQLYYHELLILNNNVLVGDAQRQSLFVPYTMLEYFITDDAETCRNASEFFRHQLKSSKLLNKAGTRDKNVFFNKAYQKIDFYKKQISAFREFG